MRSHSQWKLISWQWIELQNSRSFRNRSQQYIQSSLLAKRKFFGNESNIKHLIWARSTNINEKQNEISIRNNNQIKRSFTEIISIERNMIPMATKSFRFFLQKREKEKNPKQIIQILFRNLWNFHPQYWFWNCWFDYQGKFYHFGPSSIIPNSIDLCCYQWKFIRE